MAGFVVASAACGLALRLGALIAARLVQGAAAAVMMPSSMALIGQAFPDPVRRARAVAMWAMGGTLHAAGHDDLIYQMVTNPTGPSYAAIVNQGATTLWENLTGSGGSKDHQFLGDVAAWLIHDLVGIDQAPGSLEYRQLLIRPAIVGDLTHAAGTYTTPAGTAAVSWARGPDGRVTLTVTIPASTTAEIWVPGQQVPAAPGTTFSRMDSFDGVQYAVYNAGPGTYRFNGQRPLMMRARMHLPVN